MGFAETFKALSHPIRREILELLNQNACQQVILLDILTLQVRQFLTTLIFWKGWFGCWETWEKFYLLRIKYVSFRRYYDMVSGFKGGVRKWRLIKRVWLRQVLSFFYQFLSEFYCGINCQVKWRHILILVELPTVIIVKFCHLCFSDTFLTFQSIVLVSLEKDSVKATTPARMVKIYAWLIPLFSLIVQLSIYANALGVIKSSPALVTAFLGSIFILLEITFLKHNEIIRLAFVCHGHFLMTAIGIKRTVLLVRFGCWVACFFYLIVFPTCFALCFGWCYWCNGYCASALFVCA